MNKVVFKNGSIYSYKGINTKSNFVIIFPIFACDEQILAVPLSSIGSGSNIPLLFSNKLMYIEYREIFRARNSELVSFIGNVDDATIELLNNYVSEAFKGNNLPSMVVPTAIL